MNQRARHWGALLLFVVGGLLTWPAVRGQGTATLQIHYMDVGQGQAALLISPGGEIVLFDAGVAGECGKPLAYLQSLGLTRIDYHIASGYDAGHIGCASEIFSMFPLTHAALDRGGSSDSPDFARYVSTAGAKRRGVQPGSRVVLDAMSSNPVTIEIIAVNANGLPTHDEKALSVVAVARYGRFAAEFGGDVTGAMESLIAEKVGPVDVFTAHDHASRESATDNWLSIVRPRVAIISVSPSNRDGTPTSESLGRLHAAGVKAYWTSVGHGAAPEPGQDIVAGDVVVEVGEAASIFTVRYSGESHTVLLRQAELSAANDGSSSVSRMDSESTRLRVAPGTHAGAASSVLSPDATPSVLPHAATVQELTITTLAGLFNQRGSNDGAGATARFHNPGPIAVDRAGTVYVAETLQNTIRKITAGGVVTTFAGVVGPGGSADGSGAFARFRNPTGIAVDAAGTVYVSDGGNATIRRITPGGVVSTLAGVAGQQGSADGAGNAARFTVPRGIAVDGAGTVYVADNNTIRRITVTGGVSTIAGAAGQTGYLDGAGGAARFNGPGWPAVDTGGTVYVSESFNNAIRKISPAGIVTTFVRTAPGSCNPCLGVSGLEGIAVDAAGTVYTASSAARIIKISAGGLITTLAGGPLRNGQDGTGSVASFTQPAGFALDANNALYITDTPSYTVRKGTRSAIWSDPPIGGFDTPPDGSDGSGEVPVTGFALDDEGVVAVDVYRAPVAGEAPPPVFLGNGTFVTGARPDVAAAYPSMPNNTRAGWGYMLLSNMLPGNGSGEYTLSAFARDLEGQQTLLGTRRIRGVNSTSKRPFGTLDTPAPGASISKTAAAVRPGLHAPGAREGRADAKVAGMYTVFGWVLTPLPNTIPPDGSTIDIYVDNVLVGHPVYNQNRADIAALFPGLNNSNGAAWAFTLNVSGLTNGLHTIQAVVRDNAGNAAGMGSRYFTVID